MIWTDSARQARSWSARLMVCVALSGLGACASGPREARILAITPGYAATKVNTAIFRHHAIITQDGRQFVSFYDPEGYVLIAWRDLPSQTWTIHRTDWKGRVRDAHDVISLGISTDGLLHISYDHHGHPLRYRRSATPLDPTTFGPLVPMTGQREKRVTYPQFVNLADGTLLFFYRDGGSGNGDLCINRYRVEDRSWEVLQHPIISGEGKCNAYWCRPAVGTDGSLQLAWCWRRTGDAATNSRICYAGSRDGGRTWTRSNGEPYALPITPETAEVVDPVEENNNLSNQDSSDVDSHNRLHVVVRMNDETKVPNFVHIWFDGERWRRVQVSHFTGRYDLKGGGSLRTPLSRGDLFLDADDTVYILYRDNRQDSHPMVARAAAPDYDTWTHFALADVNLLQWEPNYDIVRWKREGILDLFILPTDQGNHETVTATGPQMASVLEWRP
ncbi:MAG: BNR repeat-containing protein [Phycisphaerae bacterium]|nr:BNR repeat-containing protein [Phycisphaerae bacterium]